MALKNARGRLAICRLLFGKYLCRAGLHVRAMLIVPGVVYSAMHDSEITAGLNIERFDASMEIRNRFVKDFKAVPQCCFVDLERNSVFEEDRVRIV